MTDRKEERRAFLVRIAAAVAGTMVAIRAIPSALAAEPDMAMTGAGGADGYVMQSSVAQRCATCDFWGGPRRISRDGKSITVTGLGWCNNPKSENYEKITSPDHGPMAVWKKWQAIS